MDKYKITGEYEISQVREFSVDWNEHSYLVICGKHINGGFFCIVNWNAAGELADFSDRFWNSESIGDALQDFEAGAVIAEAIANLK